MPNSQCLEIRWCKFKDTVSDKYWKGHSKVLWFTLPCFYKICLLIIHTSCALLTWILGSQKHQFLFVGGFLTWRLFLIWQHWFLTSERKSKIYLLSLYSFVDDTFLLPGEFNLVFLLLFVWWPRIPKMSSVFSINGCLCSWVLSLELRIDFFLFGEQSWQSKSVNPSIITNVK